MLKRLTISAWKLFNLLTKWLTTGAGDIAGIAVLFISLAIAVDVFMRYVFNAPSIWVNEVSCYILLAMTFLGLAYTHREKGHIKVDVIIKRLPKQAQDWMSVIHSIVFLIFIGVLFYLTWDVFSISIKLGTTSRSIWDIPLAPWQAFIPLGLIIIGLLLICNIYTESKIATGKSKKPH